MAVWYNKPYVVDQHFCSPQQRTFVIEEQSPESFSITDADGKPAFHYSKAREGVALTSSRILCNARNQPIVEMRRKTLSLSGKWYLCRPSKGDDQGEHKLAIVEPQVRLTNKVVHIYLDDQDTKVNFVVKGDFKAKQLRILEVSGAERLFAHIERETCSACKTTFLKDMLAANTSKYFVTVEPGVDVAFIVALALLCDEIFKDSKSWR